MLLECVDRDNSIFFVKIILFLVIISFSYYNFNFLIDFYCIV